LIIDRQRIDVTMDIMSRARRRIEEGVIYHVLNRGNGRRALFANDGDFHAFVELLGQAFERFPVDLLAFCLMGNHWHLIVRPRTDDALSRCMAWVTVTHTRRHHKHHPNPGSGHLYQGRFMSFPVQSDGHFLAVARYVHANPVRAGLVERAQDWRWNDLACRRVPTAAWPVDRPRNWTGLVNREPDDADEARAIETSIRRGTPFGAAEWARTMGRRLGLSHTLRPRGRPQKPVELLSDRQLRRRKAAGGGHKSK
jgi:putative transposase